jgi:hypothetical protein
MKHHQTRVEGRASSAGQAKRYEPVREFERATSYCPLYLAWRIADEVSDYFRTPIPEVFADKLAHRAEAVFAKHALSSAKWRRGNGRGGAFLKTPLSGSLPVWRGEREKSFWWRKFQNREFILMFMRHSLAGVLARERPALFRDLPESFKVGHPLPQKHIGGAAAPPYHKPKTVGLTCRSASISVTCRNASLPKTMRRKSDISRPASRFVHGCELLTA